VGALNKPPGAARKREAVGKQKEKVRRGVSGEEAQPKRGLPKEGKRREVSWKRKGLLIIRDWAVFSPCSQELGENVAGRREIKNKRKGTSLLHAQGGAHS